MRQRVLTVYVTLLVTACLGLALPLCGSIAARGTSDMLLDRINDTARFAGLAEPSVLTGVEGTLSGELTAYDRLYGITAVVVDRDGEVVAASREGVTLADLDPGAPAANSPGRSVRRSRATGWAPTRSSTPGRAVR